jgi:hypothetical protein
MKIYKFRDKCGGILLKLNLDKKIFYVKAFGIITPKLIKKDIEYARKFSEYCNDDWVYIVDSKCLKFAHPLNILYLKELKYLKGLKLYVVYAPSIFIRLLIYSAKFIIIPDKICKNQEELKKFLS